MVAFWTLLPYVCIAVVLFCCVTIPWFLHRRQTFWFRHGIPAASDPHLFYGHVRGISTECHTATVLLQLYRQFRERRLPAGGFNLFFSPVLLAVDRTLIERVLVRDFDQFQERGLYANAKGNPISSELLFSLGGERWDELRRRMNPVLSAPNIRTMFLDTVRIAQSLTAYVVANGSRPELEWTDLLGRYATNVIVSCAFGIDNRPIGEPRAEFRSMGHRAFRCSLRRMWKLRFGYCYRRLADALRLCVNEAPVEQFFLQLVRATVLHRECFRSVKRDFLHLLLDMKARGELNMTQVAGQCYTFFIAGFETSASLMNFCLYELAKHADVQERLRGSIVSALDETDGQLNYEMVMSLGYLDQVVNETLRMYPSVDFLFRVSNTDYKIDRLGTVPRGTIFVVPVHAIHHDPEYYPQPEVYNPDRFANGYPDGATFIPFGAGPRRCIGATFGLMLVKVGLVVLLRSFRFSLNTERMPANITFKPRSLVLALNSGMYLHVEPV